MIESNIVQKNVDQVVKENYMPYVKLLALERSLVYLDGLKPVARRILYTMNELNVWSEGPCSKKSYKCARIVGDTMGKYHPHGDKSIYDALALMTDDYNKLNNSYIHGEGTFGRVWASEDCIPASAMRYTGAALSPISRELFDGINENAVDFVDNFDKTEKEPTILPVTFPSVIVNTSKGIAVGMGSHVPSYDLKAVCMSTVGILKGQIKDYKELSQSLGAPDFTTNGFIHCSEKELEDLVRTGRGTLTMSGSVNLFNDRIEITQVPFGVRIDDIVSDAIDAIKEGKLDEVNDIINESGYDENTEESRLRATVYLKRGKDPKKVLAKLNKYTRLRNKISFNTTVVIDDTPVELGIYELLVEWIKWRSKTIQRQYKFKLEKELKNETIISAWEKVNGNLKQVLDMVTNNKEEKAVEELKSKLGFTDVQAKYIIDTKLKRLTQDRLEQELEKLKKCREDIKIYTNVVNDENIRFGMMAKQITSVAEKHGSDRYSVEVPPVVVEDEEEKIKEVIPDMDVCVIITELGLIKRITNMNDLDKLDSILDGNDKVAWKLDCKNTETVLIFTQNGNCYRIPVHSIDNNKGKFKDTIWGLLDMTDDSGVLYITNSGDYSGNFNIVYPNGRGRKVWLSEVSGKLKRYKGIFEEYPKGSCFVTKSNRFFVITAKRSASYGDFTLMESFRGRSAFKVARIAKGDRIIGLQPIERVPDPNAVDLSKYQKEYCVKIGEDILW